MPGIVIDIETGAVEARFKGMLEDITKLASQHEIADELSAWQKEDLHRSRPFSLPARPRGSAKTIVRPRSKYEMQKSKRAGKRYLRAMTRYEKFKASGRKASRRRPKYVRIIEAHQARYSSRPILRPELFSKLEERMSVFLGAKLQWANSRSEARVAQAKDEARHDLKVLIARL